MNDFQINRVNGKEHLLIFAYFGIGAFEKFFFKYLFSVTSNRFCYGIFIHNLFCDSSAHLLFCTSLFLYLEPSILALGLCITCFYLHAHLCETTKHSEISYF